MSGAKDASIQNPNRRVKVYVLGGDGQWDDRGTGYVNCEMLSEFDALGFRVLSEDALDKELLVTKIFEEEVFQRQGDTIVTWTNPETREDVALSFQEATGAQEVWELICQVQGRSPNEPLEELEAEGTVGSGIHEGHDGGDIKMPAPDMQNLQTLQDIVTNATNSSRDRIVDGVMADGYLQRLFEIFNDCEDLEMNNSLHCLFRIFKGLIMFNEPALIECCLSDDHVLSTMGILEYDPDYASHEIRHREYLSNPELFKEAVPIKDPATRQKIHLNFRLTYLKDVVMARYIDDGSFSTIRELIALNNVEIIAQIQGDSEFLDQLFTLCRKTGAEDAIGRRHGFLFLRELFEIAKPLSMPHQMAFFRSLSSHGLFSILEDAVQSPDGPIISACTDITLSSLNHDPSLLRGYLLREKSDSSHQKLLQNLINGLLHYPNTGHKAQVTEILRCLLDSSTLDQSPEQDYFLRMVYDDHMDTLMSPFLEEEKWDSDGRYLGEPTQASAVRDQMETWELRECWDATRKHVVELLSFCVEHHGQKIRNYIQRNNLLQRILHLFGQRDKHLILATLKLLRQCIGTNDVNYNKYIVKKDLFGGLIDLLKQHLYRNNLINSAIIELFDFLRMKNIKILIKYLVEKYRTVWEHITYVETFQQLIIKYDQNEEYAKDEANGTVNNLRDASARGGREGGWNMMGGRRAPRTGGVFRSRLDDDDDDSYFDEDEDDDIEGPAKPATEEAPEGLAALTSTYDDEEEEEHKEVRSSATLDSKEAGGNGIAASSGKRPAESDSATPNGLKEDSALAEEEPDAKRSRV